MCCSCFKGRSRLLEQLCRRPPEPTSGPRVNQQTWAEAVGRHWRAFEKPPRVTVDEEWQWFCAEVERALGAAASEIRAVARPKPRPKGTMPSAVTADEEMLSQTENFWGASVKPIVSMRMGAGSLTCFAPSRAAGLVIQPGRAGKVPRKWCGVQLLKMLPRAIRPGLQTGSTTWLLRGKTPRGGSRARR